MQTFGMTNRDTPFPDWLNGTPAAHALEHRILATVAGWDRRKRRWFDRRQQRFLQVLVDDVSVTVRLDGQTLLVVRRDELTQNGD